MQIASPDQHIGRPVQVTGLKVDIGIKRNMILANNAQLP